MPCWLDGSGCLLDPEVARESPPRSEKQAKKIPSNVTSRRGLLGSLVESVGVCVSSRSQHFGYRCGRGHQPRPALPKMGGPCAAPLRGVPLDVGSVAASGAIQDHSRSATLITPDAGTLILIAAVTKSGYDKGFYLIWLILNSTGPPVDSLPHCWRAESVLRWLRVIAAAGAIMGVDVGSV